MYQRALVEIRC